MVREAARELNGPAPETLDALCHLILSHHGRHEFGAPVLPMTPEAIMLHHLDDMDAKMNYTDQLREKMTESGHQWTEYQRPLERFLYLQPLAATGEKKPVTAENPAIAADPAPVLQKKSKPVKDDGQKRQQTLF
jgi:3'-5' exoribonuclease